MNKLAKLKAFWIIIFVLGLITMYVGSLDASGDLMLINGTNPHKNLYDNIIISIGLIMFVTGVLIILSKIAYKNK